jgi:hypothetical protein
MMANERLTSQLSDGQAAVTSSYSFVASPPSGLLFSEQSDDYHYVSCVLLNARSVCNKLPELHNLIYSSSVDVDR